jgi:hypothetical protein
MLRVQAVAGDRDLRTEIQHTMPLVSDPEPPLTEYPKYSAPFGRLMRRSGADQQTRLSGIQPTVDDLMAVRDDELVILENSGINAGSPSMEMGRRNIAAIARSIDAVHDLGSKLHDVQAATESASAKTIAALANLDQSIDRLRTATDTWSRWLTRLTIAICGFTLVLVVLGIAQALR